MDSVAFPPSGDDEIVFVSLGMLVLDELRFPSSPTLYDVVGGSGAYSTLGARLFNPHPHSQSTGCIVMAGKDFPESVTRVLQHWGVSLWMHVDPQRPSTRGLLIYEDAMYGRKSFSYVTPPLQPSVGSIESSRLFSSTAFHLLAKPSDVERQIFEILDVRQKHGITSRPLFIWEPAPPFCKAANHEDHLRACRLVDVFSPNHLEMVHLFDDKQDISGFDRSRLQSYAQHFLDVGVGISGQGCVVIRAGERGCLLMSRTFGPSWIPPYYSPGSQKVVDPTGAGNAFLGGFTVGVQRTFSLIEAAIFGSVSASFALEQVGLPLLEISASGETWNGANVLARLQEFKRRLP